MKTKSVKSLKPLHIRGQAGQATLEYILILTTTVILIGSIIWQFSTAFRNYADAFFDGYIGCLLETGELPGNGSDCEAEYKKFSLANGTTVVTDGSGGGGGGGGSNSGSGSGAGSGSDKGGKGNSGKNDQDASKSKSAKKNGSSSSGGGGAGEMGGSSGSGGASPFIRARNGKQRSTPVAGAKPAGGNNNKGREPLTALGSADASSGGGEGGGRRRRVALDRSYGYEGQESEQDQALTSPTTAVAKDEGGSSLKPKKVAVDASRKTASVANDDQQGFSFGNFIRIILIAGIVVLILIFFGGQILQISKSAEK